MTSNTKVPLEETLLPALVQCFGIIFIGYILGKTKILRPTEARGLSVFVQYLALPALIFTTVSTIPFTKVKWEFIASVFVAKASIFMCVSLITMLLTHPINLGKSALFAITATQSNDFALGYPLLVSLYQNTHPEYPSYLYIIAPIQLLILNTIAFLMLEIEKSNLSPSQHENCQMWHVIKGTLKNPVVVMTIIGLIWNVTYGQKVLPIIENMLHALSSAFPAAALLLVGYTMTVRSEKQSSQISLSVLLLILTKNIILPLILQKFSAFMLQDSTSKEIQSLSSFAFLYGTIPTAPSAYVFALQYDSSIDAVTKSVLGSTLLAAPLMFASASVISLAQIGVQNIIFYLSQTISYLSAVNLVCCFWSITIFWVGKRFKSISFGIVFYLVFAQFLMALGGIMLFFTSKDFSTLFYVQYVLANGGVYATRACTLLLATLLLTIRIRSLCFILRFRKQINIISVFACIVIPYAVAASLLLYKEKAIYGPNFQLGCVQVIVTFVWTFICLVGTIISLILHQVFMKRNSRNSNEELRSGFYQNPHLECTQADTCVHSNVMCCDIEDFGRNFGVENRTEEDSLIPNSTYNRICDPHYQCSAAQRAECSVQVERYIDESSEIGTGLVDDEYFFKHVILLILLSLAMTVSLFICIWKLLLEDENGIYIELEFLDVILNYSVGIVCFVMFGLDSNLINKIIKRFKIGSQCDDVECSESKRVCDLFLSNHYNRCKKDIGQIKLINNEYNCIFNVNDLTNWLLSANIIQTNQEGDHYVSCLIKGHIVERHCNKYECYNDKDLYVFTNYNLSFSV